MHSMISIPLEDSNQTGELAGRLVIPVDRRAAVLVLQEPAATSFAEQIACHLNRGNLATLVTDGLTADEHRSAQHAAEQRSDVALIGDRLAVASDWLADYPALCGLRIGYFASGIGAASALWAAAERPALIDALVAVDARPLLASPALGGIRAPTLFITSTRRLSLLRLNQAGFARLLCQKHLEIVPATRVEPVARIARAWFELYLPLTEIPRRIAAPQSARLLRVDR